jgi:hypothetical protein
VAKPPAPIPFPVLDDLQYHVIEWADGRPANVVQEMKQAKANLQRVKGSRRHQKLAEFLHHAITAFENREPEGARYILLTAMAAFGWPAWGGAEPDGPEEDTGMSVRTRTS